MSGVSISSGVEVMTSQSGLRVSAREHQDRSGNKSDSSHDSSTDRKVISHLFGRNKVCTRQIPEDLFEKIPRKRYQRLRYIESKWAFRQLEFLRAQLKKMEKWGGVRSWAIELKAAIKTQIEQEDAKVAGSSSGNSCAERFLLPHLGSGKSFRRVYLAIDAIEEDLNGRVEKNRRFPGVEFLPNIDIQQYPPRPLNGKAPSTLSLAIRDTDRRPSKPMKEKSKSSLSLETGDRKQHPSSRRKGESKSLSSLETLETQDLVKLWLKEKEEYDNTRSRATGGTFKKGSRSRSTLVSFS